ncbi:hypothetical protein V1T76_25665 [Roseibium sp. FZY0029]|uniref:hypothetical protein n=1 Tax=Roseibium sp. FZY0029 TaxID=3116647 RepID=UPI002E9ACD36|nr:hypothetical protein [Roseibium sp. FZY0029]
MSRINRPVLGDWLERAGPEPARLGFAISTILAPAAIYVGGTLPHLVREELARWLEFASSDPFDGARVVQPEILLPEVNAADTVAFGAAVMALHDLAAMDQGVDPVWIRSLWSVCDSHGSSFGT